nr:MAG TPA_asm: hypothetical protein [Caudoviricetes sp.]
MVNARECRFCKHYSTLGLPEKKGACLKNKKRVGMFDTCESYRNNGLDDFLKKFLKG